MVTCYAQNHTNEDGCSNHSATREGKKIFGKSKPKLTCVYVQWITWELPTWDSCVVSAGSQAVMYVWFSYIMWSHRVRLDLCVCVFVIVWGKNWVDTLVGETYVFPIAMPFRIYVRWPPSTITSTTVKSVMDVSCHLAWPLPRSMLNVNTFVIVTFGKTVSLTCTSEPLTYFSRRAEATFCSKSLGDVGSGAPTQGLL